MKATTLDAYNLLHDGILALTRAEQMGMRIDVEYCQEQKVYLTKKIAGLEKQLMDTRFIRRWKHIYGSKFKLTSDMQLAHMLYKILKIEPTKMTESEQRGSTDDETLSQINMPELNILLEMRKAQKVRDTYLEAFMREQVNGILHPFFNLHTVRTYRSSSSNPNFQNIPARDEESMNICRGAIYPRKGHQLVELDFKGIEVGVSPCYHKDPNMLKYVSDPTTDMHRDMAQQIFLLKTFNKKIHAHSTLRKAAKNGFVFPQFYGDWYKSCAYNLACQWGKIPQNEWKAGQGMEMPTGTLAGHLINEGIKSFDDFVEHIRKIEDDFWNRRFRVYQKWKDKTWADYQRSGYLDMLTGFRCSGVMDRKQVCNTPIQGAAFHCLLWSFIKTDYEQRHQGWHSRLIGQIHDSMVLDVHPTELTLILETIRNITTELLPKAWPWIIVPLEIEAEVCGVDESWAKKKPYKLNDN